MRCRCCAGSSLQSTYSPIASLYSILFLTSLWSVAHSVPHGCRLARSRIQNMASPIVLVEQRYVALFSLRSFCVRTCRVYCTNRAYYAAAVLGGLQHADQRITEDVERFCSCLSELHSYTFKPLLDVMLFTQSLSSIMGYRSQLALYSYYIATAALTRFLSPPLAQMTS